MEKHSFNKAIYIACLESAKSMGDRIKSLSWFGKNHTKSAAVDEEKRAA